MPLSLVEMRHSSTVNGGDHSCVDALLSRLLVSEHQLKSIEIL